MFRQATNAHEGSHAEFSGALADLLSQHSCQDPSGVSSASDITQAMNGGGASLAPWPVCSSRHAGLHIALLLTTISPMLPREKDSITANATKCCLTKLNVILDALKASGGQI